MNDFQERLIELLQDNNLTKQKFANNINKSFSTINEYFLNDYYPQISVAIIIAKYFKVSLDYLFGLSDEKINTNKETGKFFDKFNALVKINNKSILKTMNDMNFNESNYYRWKKGLIPKTYNLLTIAKYFNVGLDFLVGNVDD
ncbi:MAG: helix-turn-helix transcriptional regulator [Clostridia bacterium]|nr:helix-turn-helix transcriptional regulator [Clostridia bacterium]